MLFFLWEKIYLIQIYYEVHKKELSWFKFPVLGSLRGRKNHETRPRRKSRKFYFIARVIKFIASRWAIRAGTSTSIKSYIAEPKLTVNRFISIKKKYVNNGKMGRR